MKLLIVDDHPVVREGLAALLRQLGPETIVLQSGDTAHALAQVPEHADLDIVVLDLMMAGASSLAAIGEFGRTRPELPIIVLSSSEDPQDARRALAQGALGYVPKSASQRTLLGAIRLVLNGDLYIPPLLLEALGPPVRASAPETQSSGLTERQIDVVRRLSAGDSNYTIAVDLGLSEKTVKAHVSAIFRALNVVSRTQAAAAARALGLIPGP
jgi:DNA-binding NarL/FixJ family response regulator